MGMRLVTGLELGDEHPRLSMPSVPRPELGLFWGCGAMLHCVRLPVAPQTTRRCLHLFAAAVASSSSASLPSSTGRLVPDFERYQDDNTRSLDLSDR